MPGVLTLQPSFIGKFSDMGLPDALGFLIIVAAAIVVGVILGFIIEQGILKHMYERDEVLIVLATFGLFLVLEDIILIAFGTDPYFRISTDGAFGFG